MKNETSGCLNLAETEFSENKADSEIAILNSRLRAFWTRRSFMAVLYAENLMLFRSAGERKKKKTKLSITKCVVSNIKKRAVRWI